jgi:hypothetical protein
LIYVRNRIKPVKMIVLASGKLLSDSLTRVGSVVNFSWANDGHPL